MLRLSCLFFLSALSVTASSFVGDYRGEFPDSQKHFDAQGNLTKEIPQTLIVALRLADDGTLLSTWSRDGEPTPVQFFWGVWKVRDGRVHYFLRSELHAAFGAQEISETTDGIELGEVAGGPLFIQRISLRRVSNLEFPRPRAGFSDPMQRELERVMRPVPAVEFAGAATEGEFRERVSAAFHACDIAELMRLTYPITKGVRENWALDLYLDYENTCIQPGMLEVRYGELEQVAKHLEDMRRFGGGFPEFVSVRGTVSPYRAVGRGGGGEVLFYGVNAGKWAILGSPLPAEGLRRVNAARR